MDENSRGKIMYEDRARQLINFSGININTITPTDIDGLLTDFDGMIEYHNKFYIWLEIKLKGTELHKGQMLALERLCDDLQRSGKQTLVIVSDHEEYDVLKQIDAANTVVRQYRSNYKWLRPENIITTIKVINQFLKQYDNKVI